MEADGIKFEINRIFGEKMAELFASQITDEELMEEAKKAFNSLKQRSNGNYISSYGFSSQRSEFEIEVTRQIFDRYKKTVTTYLESEEIQADLDQKAKELVKRIREDAENKIVDAASKAILRTYQGMDVEFVAECIDRAFRR